MRPGYLPRVCANGMTLHGPCRTFEQAAVDVAEARVGRKLPGHERTRAIIKAVAKSHRLTVRDLIEPAHFPHIVAARHEAIRRVHAYWIAQGKKKSRHEIGLIFKRDPSTIFHALYRSRRGARSLSCAAG